MKFTREKKERKISTNWREETNSRSVKERGGVGRTGWDQTQGGVSTSGKEDYGLAYNEKRREGSRLKSHKKFR